MEPIFIRDAVFSENSESTNKLYIKDRGMSIKSSWAESQSGRQPGTFILKYLVYNMRSLQEQKIPFSVGSYLTGCSNERVEGEDGSPYSSHLLIW